MVSRIGCSLTRLFSTSFAARKTVSVIGASGGVGQSLSLLLKVNPSVTKLKLYDIKLAPGLAVDLAHCNTKSEVTGYVGDSQLRESMEGADIVVVTASGSLSKPMESRDDLYNLNAALVANIAQAAVDACPDAMLAVISNPVNSMVPIFHEIFKKAGKDNHKRLFGVTTLDVIRTDTFIANAKGLNPVDVRCPVVGGHQGNTIIPLISQCKPSVDFPDDKIKALTERVQDAGFEVVRTREDGGSATLAMSYAAALFTDSLIHAMNGTKDVVECAYVASNVTDAAYFSTPVLLGPNGMERNFGLGDLTEYEKGLVDIAIPELQASIKKGIDFVQKNY